MGRYCRHAADRLSRHRGGTLQWTMHINVNHPLLHRIVDELVDQGWSHQSIFMPERLTTRLAEECRTRAVAGDLTPAGIGRGDGQVIREGIRGDLTQWLEPGESEACDEYLRVMDSLRQTLNASLFLGLEDFECHFALYPPGAYYQKHVDRFRDDDARTVSAVLYLNDAWLPEHGGALRLHLPQRQVDIQPTGGSLVVFMSAGTEHEVLPASRDRLSLTGWFRRRNESLLQLS
ncbi:2OG-Fe(II) oxygenase [Pseudomonas aeruginosa]